MPLRKGQICQCRNRRPDGSHYAVPALQPEIWKQDSYKHPDTHGPSSFELSSHIHSCFFFGKLLEGSSVWMASQSMAGSSCWTAWDTRWSRPRMPLGCRRTCETTCLLETWHAHLHATQVGQLLELVAQGPHALRLALEAPEQSFKRFLLGLGLQDCEAAIEQQPNVAEAYLLASRRCAYHF